MASSFLTPEQRRELILRHRREHTARYADRIKTVLWLDEGVPFSEIARRLFLDEKTPRHWAEIYRQNGIDALIVDNYRHYRGKLGEEQKQKLFAYVQSHIFLDVGPIILYAHDEFNIRFSREGMRDLLHRLGFTYKKASHIPKCADREKQRRFLDAFKQLMAMKSPETPVLFMDATHPSYNSMPTYGWILKGERAEVPCNNSHRQQVNINAALDSQTHEIIMVESERIDSESTIRLLQNVENRYPESAQIFVIADNASYYHSKPVVEYVRTSRIQLIYLPPYSSNLNLIERVWKFMHKHTVANYLHASFKEFREEIILFFTRLSEDLADSLDSLLALNFHLMPEMTVRKNTMI